jgi:hypothetical protein
MRGILLITFLASVCAFGQKIETQKADRQKITRVATSPNHLTVLEFNEPVKEVAVGSSNFKVEWRENKVFVQPLEPDGTTNLFVWTASGRQSYELVPAGTISETQFAIDEEPVTPAKADPPPPPKPAVEQPKVPAAMLLESTPVKSLVASKDDGRVRIALRDVYEKDGRVFLRYAIVNRSEKAYVPGPPDVFTLKSPRSPQSLIPLATTQLGSDFPIKWKDVDYVRLRYSEAPTSAVQPEQTAHGLIAFDLPASTQPGERTVLRLTFPDDSAGHINVLLVL